MTRHRLAANLTTLALLCALALALALALAVTASAAPAPSTAQPAASLLFVQRAGGGQLERVRQGVFRLRLRGVSARVSTFTDHPRRRAGQQRTQRFVRGWRRNGFAADPPNAALVFDRAPRTRDVALLSLSRPRYDARQRTLTYTARPLRGPAAGSLASFAKRRDGLSPRSFGAASLFIDDGSEITYEPVTLIVNNAGPGQTVAVQLTSDGEASWSGGPPLNPESGVEIYALFGSLPLAELDLSSSAITIRLQEGSTAPANFVVHFFLVVAADVRSVSLRSTSDSGVQVNAAIGHSDPQLVNQTPTPFPWNPF